MMVCLLACNDIVASEQIIKEYHIAIYDQSFQDIVAKEQLELIHFNCLLEAHSQIKGVKTMLLLRETFSVGIK